MEVMKGCTSLKIISEKRRARASLYFAV